MVFGWGQGENPSGITAEMGLCRGLGGMGGVEDLGVV